MKNSTIRILLAVALASLTACKSGGGSRSNTFPSRVWEGGTPVVVELEAGAPVRLWAFFETNLQVDDPKHKLLEVSQQLPAGKHRLTVDVPRAVGGSIGISTTEAPVGTYVRIALSVNGVKGGTDEMTLERPLTPGNALGAQLEVEEFAKGR